jgi:sensor c-di-GMP phosphodiesterase-like protein
MRVEYNEELDLIINARKIKTVFQPIISLQDGGILGHEAQQHLFGRHE